MKEGWELSAQPFVLVIAMKTVTAIEAQKRGGDRVNVFLDGAFAFSLEMDVVAEKGLRLGQALSPWQIEELERADLFHKCFKAALRLLSYRPRSEAEIRVRLRPRFEPETMDRVLLRLKERRLVDDTAFAQFWRENRESFSPRSKRLLKLELRRKGIEAGLAEEAVGGIDDEESALRAAQGRLRPLAQEDYETFRRKLFAFLRRRGFSYEVAERTVQRLWQEAR